MNRSKVFLWIFFILFVFFAVQGTYIFGVSMENLSLVLQDIALVEWGLSYLSLIVASEIVLKEDEPQETFKQIGVCNCRTDDPAFDDPIFQKSEERGT